MYSLELVKGTGISAVSGAGNYFNGKKISIDATVSSGYTWSTWTKNSGTAPASAGTKATTVTIGANTKLTASATANTYTVTLNRNSGTGGTASVTATYNSAMPSATMPTRTGYTFQGYYDTSAATGGTQYYTAAGASARAWNKTAATTLYARWTANKIKITINKNGGTGGTDAFWYNYGTSTFYSNEACTTTITAITPTTKRGYTLSNYIGDGTCGGNNGEWYVRANGTFADDLATDVYKDATLSANWVAKKIKITLNKNGGTGGTDAIWYNYGTNTIYSDEACTTTITSIIPPTRQGYTFNTYYGDGSSGGNNLEVYIYAGGTFAGDLVTDIYDNATLYARWTANTYTVTLNGNGGTGGTASVTATYDSAMPSATMPTKTGYTFQGYYDAESGGTQYYTATGASARTWDKTSDTTLYARWTANTYTVTYATNGGSVSPTSKSVTYGSAYGTLPIPTKTGYTLNNWSLLPEGYQQVEYIQSNGTQCIDTGVKFNSNTDKFELIYQANDANGNYFIAGSGWQENGYLWVYSYKSGNRFAMYIKDTGGSQRAFYGFDGPDTLKHTIEYDAKKLYVDNQLKADNSSYTFGETPYNFSLFNAINSTGYFAKTKIYSFKMWKNGTLTRNMIPCVETSTGKAGFYDLVGNKFYTSTTGVNEFSKGNNVSVTTSTVVQTPGNHNIYARWTANTNTVTLNRNNGSGGTESVTATYDAAMPSATMPTRTGYTFAGYYDTSAATGGTQYYTASGASARTWDKTSDTTLYARWTANTYTVTLNPNGGTVSPTSKTVTYGSAYGELPTPTKTEYTFAGWKGSNLINISDTNVTFSNYYYLEQTSTPAYALKPNTTYTLSFDYVVNSASNDIYASVGYGQNYSKDIVHGSKYSGTGKYTLTFTTPSSFLSDVTNVWFRLVRMSSPGSASVDISNIQLVAETTTADDIVTIPSNHTLNAKWQPNLELIGKSEIGILDGTTYTDAGYSVAGLNKEQSEAFNEDGYHVVGPVITKDGTELENLYEASVGEYLITYNLLNSNNGIVNSVSRKVTVGYGNYSVGSKFYPTLATAYSAITESSGIIEVERDTIDDSNFVVEDGKYIVLKLNGKTITKNTNNITNNGILIIQGNGTIKTEEATSLIKNTGILTIGEGDGNVSTTAPVIQGGTYAVENTGTFSFNDGILKGTEAAISGLVTDRETQYTVIDGTETINGTTYHTAVLKRGYTINFHPNILPEEYTQVEYIESTGTQYIDTEFAAPNGMKVEVTSEWLGAGTIVGSHNLTAPYGRNYIGYSGGNYAIGYGDLYPDAEYEGLALNKKMNVEFSTIIGNAYLIADGNEIYTNTSTQTLSDNNVLIFTNQWNFATYNNETTKAKLYSAKIYDHNGALVRDFIPCYQTSTGIAGLYDLVNGVFYTNQGTGDDFEKGPDLVRTQSFFYDEAQHLDTNMFAFEKYHFINWNTQRDGSGLSYEDRANVMNATPVVSDNIDLYAQWTSREYTITYDLSGGINNSDNPSSYTKETETITLKDPTKLGATFFGWDCTEGSNAIGMLVDKYSHVTINDGVYTITNPSTNNNYSSSKIQLCTSEGNVYAHRYSALNGILQGVYKHNISSGTYIIRFGLNGSTIDGCVRYNVNLVQGKYYYYYLNCNCNNQGGTITDFKVYEVAENRNITIPKGSTGNKTFKAYWVENLLVNHNIYYDLNGGTNHSQNPSTYTTEDAITLQPPTKASKSFFGWNCTQGSNLLASYNKSYTLTNATEGNNYNCVKWQILQSGTFLLQPSTIWGVGKLNGVYKHTLSSGTYQFRLAANGNKADNTAISYVDVNLTQGKYYYYEFNVSSFSTQQIVIDNAILCEVTENRDVTIPMGSTGAKTFTAYWLDGLYTVKLDNQSATTAGTEEIFVKNGTGYYLDVTETKPMNTNSNGITVPAKTGYVFDGYYTATNGEGTQYIDANGRLTSSASNTNFGGSGTLYAKWTVNSYSVDGIRYPTLAAAYSAITGSEGTIKVEQDNTDASNFVVEAGKEITLNTNGKTIIKTVKELTNNGTLTIEGEGKITTEEIDKNNLERNLIVSYGTLNINECILENKGIANVATNTLMIYDGVVNLNGGTIRTTVNSETLLPYSIRTITLRNSSSMIINDGLVENSSLENSIAIELWNAPSNESIPGYLKILGGTVRNTTGDAIQSNGSANNCKKNVIISSGTVEGYTSGINFTNMASGNITITGGTIKSEIGEAIKNEGSGTLAIGTKGDGNVSVDSPIIQGATYGIDSANGFNFYDGIIKGGTAAYNTAPTEIESGYGIVNGTEDIDGVEYQTAFLQILKRILMSETYENAYRDKKILGQDVFNIGGNDKTVKRGDISSITIQNSSTAPSGAVTSWDVSFAHNGSVLAWLVPHGNQYDLIIGAAGEIDASEGQYLFYGYEDLTAINGLANLNTSDVTTMESMFKNCCSLTTLDVSSLDTSNVTNMANMFAGIQNVTELDLSTFNTEKATNMSGMFWDALKLEEVDMTDWDTSNITDMSHMYTNCYELAQPEVERLDTSKVEDMSYMFYGCDSIDKLNLSNFDTSNVTNMRDMFNDCDNLEALNLKSFDTTNVEDMQHMFSNCGNLKSMLLGDNFDKLSGEEMFEGDDSLEAIITTRTTPMALTTNTKVDELEDATLYVPNETAKATFESGENYNTQFGSDRVEPILELVGDNPITVKKRQEFTDPGVTVAGVASGDSGDYTWYGFEQNNAYEKDGEPAEGVDTTKTGEYTITYGIALDSGDNMMEVERTVIVKNVEITDVTISGDNFVYTGSAIEPEVIVKNDDGEVLVKDVDYTVAFDDNINVGTALVVVTGIGNYEGTAERHFTIASKTLQIPYAIRTYVYNREEQTVELANFSGDLMTVSGDTAISAGTHEAVVSLRYKNNYEWPDHTKTDKVVPWQILRKPITDNDVYIDLSGFAFEYTGAQIKPAVVATLLAEGVDYTVSYTNNTNVGEATATITGINNYEGTIVKHFDIITNKLNIPDITGTYKYTGEEQQAKFVDYYPDKMTVSGDRATEVGTYNITFSLIDKDNNEWVDETSGDKTIQWTILPKPISDEDINVIVSGDNFEYTGSAIEPEVIVTQGSTQLVEGRDYTISYADNTDVGEATITVTGTNNYTDVVTKTFTIKSRELEIPEVDGRYIYTGSQQTANFTHYEQTKMTVTGNTGTNAGDYVATFNLIDTENYKWVNGSTGAVTAYWTIEQKSLNGEGITVVTSSNSFVYTGEAIQPEISITYGSIQLSVGTDYTVDYSNNLTPGNATISITGQGNYKDTKTIGFTITKKILPEPSINGSYTFTGIEQTVDINDYDETYMDIVSGDKATTVGTYYVEIELKDKVNYEWSTGNTDNVVLEWRIANKAITHQDVEIELLENNIKYTGSEIEPEVVVRDNGVLLVENVDYELDYLNNTNAGTGTVIIRGIGNYAGQTSRDFTISKASLMKPVIAGVYVYDRTLQTVNLNFYDENTMTASGNTRTNAGAQNVEISLRYPSNYEWEDGSTEDVVRRWIINPKALPSDISISGGTEYSGGAVTPTITVRDDGIELVQGTDFLVEYHNNTSSGISRAVVTGTGNYAGTAEITFNITKRRVAVPTISGSYVYNGTEQTIIPTGFDGTTMNVYDNTRTDAGTQQVRVSLKDPDNYEWSDGTTSDKFIEWEIASKGVDGVTVTLESYLYTYTGDPIRPSATVRDGGVTLTNGTDYDVTYENNVEVGEGRVIVTFKNNYTGTITETFEINGILVTKPTLIEDSYLYNGTEQTAQLANYNDEFMTITNNKQTEAGTYTMVISLRNTSRYQWADHTSADITLTWTIVKRTAVAPTAIRRTYNGEEQIGISQGVGYTLTGDPTAIDAGNYTATAVLNPNYMWEDGSTEDIVYNWDISKKSVEAVWGNQISFVYNGNEQAPTVTVTSPIAKETIYLKRSLFVNAGVHTSIAQIDYVAGGRDKASNYALTNVQQDFEITRANAVLELETTSIGVDIGEDRFVGYTYTGDGIISVASDNDAIAICHVDTSNKKIKIDGVAEGITSITVRASQGNNYNAVSETIYVISSDGRPKINSVSINSGAETTKNIEVVVRVDASSDFADVKEMFIGETNVIPADAEWTSYKQYSIYRMSGGNGSRTLYIWVKDSRGKIGEMKTASINLQARYTIKLRCMQTGTYDLVRNISYALRADGGSYPAWQSSDTFTGLVPGVVYYAKTLYEIETGGSKESAELRFKVGYDAGGNLILDEM